MSTIYDFTVKDQKGNDVSLKEYEGKVILVVNTATGCGFTPQYEGLQKLYDTYKDQGFVILDFPCNQFGHQAPGSDEEIHQFCSLKYNASFPQFKKIDVNGDNADPLYKWLKEQKGGILGSNIKWNFSKFLLNRKGEVINRYAPTTTPEKLEEDVVAELKK
ncbi:MAG: glutathione peroxidase [Bacilli bacterium]|jgi:glutathione peroxidase|nr:glutathione peroxidase [Bacilli bacterium]